MTPDDLLETIHLCMATLEPEAERDWTSARAHDLDWTCRQALEHMVLGPLYFSLNLAMRSTSVIRGVGANTASSTPELLRAVEGAVTVLARLAAEAPPGTRGCHAAGMADP